MNTFTVFEANALLPEVRDLLERIRGAVKGFEDYRKLYPNDDEESKLAVPDTVVLPAYYRLVSVFHRAMNRVKEIGYVIKDVSRGLVDFPTVIAGEEAFLCWEENEENIRFWHGTEDGFAGRQPIPDE